MTAVVMVSGWAMSSEILAPLARRLNGCRSPGDLSLAG